MAKFLITFVREMSLEVEVEALTEEEARAMFYNDETAGERPVEVIEDKIVKVETYREVAPAEDLPANAVAAQ